MEQPSSVAVAPHQTDPNYLDGAHTLAEALDNALGRYIMENPAFKPSCRQSYFDYPRNAPWWFSVVWKFQKVEVPNMGRASRLDAVKFYASVAKDWLKRDIDRGELAVLGYLMPRSYGDKLKPVPRDVLAGDWDLKKSALRHNGLSFEGVLVVYPSDLTAPCDSDSAVEADKPSPNEPINPKRRAGRPSLADEMLEVYRALRDGRRLSPHDPKNSLYALVRNEVKARFPKKIDANNPDKGLGDDAIANAIRKRIDEDKQSGRYSPDKL